MESNLQTVQSFYRSRFEKFGRDSRSLDLSLPSQQGRFRVLSEMTGVGTGTLLDVGCGFGDFLDYLKRQGAPPHYTGLDLSPDFLAEASARHPDGEFVLGDITAFPADRAFDWVVAVGTFNVRFRPDQEAWLDRTLEKMFALCRVGMAVSLISTWGDPEYKREEICYYSPERTLAFCREMTRWVSLRHDYMPHDFTVCLRRKPGVEA